MPPKGDLNKDCVVNDTDKDILLQDWGKTGTGLRSDLNADGKPDLAVIAQDGTLRVHRHSGRTNLGAVDDTGIRLGNVDLLRNVEMALAKGKAQYDKRETLKRRQAEREMQRAMRHKSVD